MILSVMSIRLDALTVKHPTDGAQRPLVDGVTAEAGAGRMTALLGPNGAGKTSLLHALVQPPFMGVVRVLGQDFKQARPVERARRLALIPQRSRDTLGFTVAECLRMGRHPHGDGARWSRGAGPCRSLAAVGFESPRAWLERRLDTLSGGEHRRVLVARAAAQVEGVDAAVLADEPTAGLDPRHAEAVLGLLRHWSRTRPVLVVLHDLDAAARYADDVWLMDRGRLVASGPTPKVLEPDTLRSVYGMHFGEHRRLGPLAGVTVVPPRP